jgi:hypothetical protein
MEGQTSANPEINEPISDRRPSTTREDSLFQNVQKKQKDILQLEAELDKVLAETAEIKKEWKDATNELNKLRAERNYKVDDNYFIAAWKELRYEIKNWAFQHFGGELRSTVLKLTPTSNQILDVVYNYKLYLGSPQLRPMLMQAVVWHMLSHQVFMGPNTKEGVVWAGYQYWNFRGIYNLLEAGMLEATHALLQSDKTRIRFVSCQIQGVPQVAC